MSTVNVNSVSAVSERLLRWNYDMCLRMTTVNKSDVIVNETSCCDVTSTDHVTKMAALGAVLVSLIVTIIVGNCLIVLSVVMFPKMKTLSNALIVSLASADLLLAVIVLPISLQVTLAVYIKRLSAFVT